MKRGLTIGKFAPLHKGHQMLIELALKETDELVVIVYDAPSHTSIPLYIRASWIKKLYPDVVVIEAWNVPKDVGWTDEIQQKHEDYVLSLLEGVSIDAFYSSEAYGFRMSKALGCKNIVVDLGRHTIAISGTKIRENIFQNRHYLEPIVYSDFITKVAISGNSDIKIEHILNNLSEINHTIALFNPDDKKIEDSLYDSNRFLFAGFSHNLIPKGFDLSFLVDDHILVEDLLLKIQSDLACYRKF